MTLTSYKKHDSLQRRLNNLCAIIEKLFSVSPRPLATLKEHIGRLEDLIVDLPDEENWLELVDKYRNTVVRFWQQYDNDQAGVPQPSGQVNKRKSEPTVQKAHNVSSLLLHQVKSSTRFDDDLSPSFLPTPEEEEQVRTVLKQAFDQLDHIDSVETNFETLKHLLMLVTKAHAITKSYPQTSSLPSDIFNYAFDKLPEQLRSKYYLKQHQNKKKCPLLNFIKSEIKQHSLHLQFELDIFEATTTRGGDNPTKDKVCFYCKQIGHLSCNCIVLKSSLCNMCFQFGHTTSRCPNGKVCTTIEDF